MKKIGTMMLTALLLATLFQTCYWESTTGPGEDIDYPIPEEGKWYCETLSVTLDLNPHAHGQKRESSIEINGEKISCSAGTEINTPYIFLVCQDSESKDYFLGQSIYWWTFIGVNGTEMILEDYKTGENYSFIKVDE